MTISANVKPLQPRYKHDCKQCNLIGQLPAEDVYICTNEGSLVLRDGDAGGEYCSFPLEIARLVASEHADLKWAIALHLYDWAIAQDEQFLVYRGEVA